MQRDAFSTDHYIINQRRTRHLKYGLPGSHFNGCGWIAAYNLLRAAGQRPGAETIAAELARGLTAGGLLGTGPLRLTRYLQSKGLAVMGGPLRKNAAGHMPPLQGGILLYATGLGLHYVAFLKAAGGRYRFLNAMEGQENYTNTLEGFVQRHAKLPLLYLIRLR